MAVNYCRDRGHSSEDCAIASDFEMDNKENDDFQPAKKKAKVAKQKKQVLSERFQKSKSDEEMKRISKGYVPPNTQKNTAWAMAVFREWRLARNRDCSIDKCHENLFEDAEVSEINHWVRRFISEVRRKDGQPYPP